MVVAAVQGRRVEKYYWRYSRGVVSDVGKENGYDGFEFAVEVGVGVGVGVGFDFVVEAVEFGLWVEQYECRFEAFAAPGR